MQRGRKFSAQLSGQRGSESDESTPDVPVLSRKFGETNDKVELQPLWHNRKEWHKRKQAEIDLEQDKNRTGNNVGRRTGYGSTDSDTCTLPDDVDLQKKKRAEQFGETKSPAELRLWHNRALWHKKQAEIDSEQGMDSEESEDEDNRGHGVEDDSENSGAEDPKEEDEDEEGEEKMHFSVWTAASDPCLKPVYQDGRVIGFRGVNAG